MRMPTNVNRMTNIVRKHISIVHTLEHVLRPVSVRRATTEVDGVGAAEAGVPEKALGVDGEGDQHRAHDHDMIVR